MRERAYVIIVLAAAAALWFGGAGGAADEPVSLRSGDQRISYGRDIRPILSDRCFQCHGVDSAKREADLRLDVVSSATGSRRNGPAIVPGKPDVSGLWKHITSDDPDELMPPPTSGKRPLSEVERALVRRWIEEGAAYEAHWSFVPPVRLALPAVKDEGWGRNAIDRFIAADLAHRGLRPSAEADKATLLRRVFLDLTGLPPTAEQLQAFIADPSPDAYERWVDMLLTEEPFVSRYAERMTSPWLDQARYADTSGIHRDQGRSIWPWRDWVLRSFRDNTPFDRFVREQLAGDLIPDATVDQQVATGFCRAHVTSDEGGAIDEEYLLEYAVDRVSTTGAVMLGLTLGCARCHDHKFDPVTATDFYSLMAFFNSIEEKGVDEQVRTGDIAFPPSLTIIRPEDQEKIDALTRMIAELKAEEEAIAAAPEHAGAVSEFISRTRDDAAVRWVHSSLLRAEAAGGATMTARTDGSVLVSGTNPGTDEHRFVLHTDSPGVRLVLIEGLRDASNNDFVGRSGNGNVVVTGITAEAVSSRDPSQRTGIAFSWVWANDEQTDTDNFRAANLLVGDERGWAVAGHTRPGDRVLLLLMEQPVGFEGGTHVHLTIEYKSPYAQHVFIRPRVRLGEIGEAGLAMLPTATSAWYVAGPFPAGTLGDGESVFDQAFAPEGVTGLDLGAEFPGKKTWVYERQLSDTGRVVGPSTVVGARYFARQVYAPSARRLSAGVGSDDGLRILVNGAEVFRNDVERGLTPEQDQVVFNLPAGVATQICKVVNTGGPDGFANRDHATGRALTSEFMAALLPDDARSPELTGTLKIAWLLERSPGYKAAVEARNRVEADLARVKAALPRTMVMKERAQPRETYVMLRGRYDHPDRSRPVSRQIPAFLGQLEGEGPKSRLDLADWITGPGNPLLARVAVNRLWEQFFSTGIVRTSEDFGYQGEYPAHPELLDWLAVEFRESGWDVKGLVKLIVTSATYRQSSRVRPDAVAVDPDNRLLAYFPRQRLSAEQLRDQALFVSGLLVEKFGGPSERPYQPAGLWEEVAMPDSPTRVYVQDTGEGLWRRSLYTYWKRAAPPPSMLAFDAPTRESCVVRRTTTNTPLQALVLWNDPQFVEAARALGARAVAAGPDDGARLRWLHLTAAGREPAADELAILTEGLAHFRERYGQNPEDAAKLLLVGEAPVPANIAPGELAAWTMLASAVLCSDAAIVKR